MSTQSTANQPIQGTRRKPETLESTQHGGKHYKGMAIEVVEYCHANDIGFNEGNVIKYITRHALRDRESGLKDAKKALHYAQIVLELEYGVATEVRFSDDPEPATEPISEISAGAMLVNFEREVRDEIKQQDAADSKPPETPTQCTKGYAYIFNQRLYYHSNRCIEGKELQDLHGPRIWNYIRSDDLRAPVKSVLVNSAVSYNLFPVKHIKFNLSELPDTLHRLPMGSLDPESINKLKMFTDTGDI
jgi:hypothetical protein